MHSVGEGKDIPGRGNTMSTGLERAQNVLGPVSNSVCFEVELGVELLEMRPETVPSTWLPLLFVG